MRREAGIDDSTFVILAVGAVKPQKDYRRAAEVLAEISAGRDALLVIAGGVLDASGLPHGPKTHIVERWRQTAPGVLEDAITVEDPDVFAAPWRYVRAYHYRPDLRLQEYSCLDNNRNLDAQGLPTFPK